MFSRAILRVTSFGISSTWFFRIKIEMRRIKLWKRADFLRIRKRALDSSFLFFFSFDVGKRYTDYVVKGISWVSFRFFRPKANRIRRTIKSIFHFFYSFSLSLSLGGYYVWKFFYFFVESILIKIHQMNIYRWNIIQKRWNGEMGEGGDDDDDENERERGDRVLCSY